MIPPDRNHRNANPVHDSGTRFRTRRGPNRLQRFWRAHKQWYTDRIDVSLLREYIRQGGSETAFVEARSRRNGAIQSFYPAWVKPELDALGNAYQPTKEAPPPGVTAEVNTAIALTQILRHSRNHNFPPFPHLPNSYPEIPLGECPEIEDVPLNGTTAPINAAQLSKQIGRRYRPEVDVALGPFRHPIHQRYTHGQPIPGSLVNTPPTTDLSLPSWTFSHKLYGSDGIHIQVWSRQPSDREVVIKHIRYSERASWDDPTRWFWIGTPTAEDPDAGTQTDWLAETYFMYRLSACNSILSYYGSEYDNATGVARIGMQCADFGELNFLCERRSLTLKSSRYEAALSSRF